MTLDIALIVGRYSGQRGQAQAVAVDLRIGSALSFVAQRGVSLVELMVALTIGMVVLLAISVLFSQISTGFRSSDAGARAVENGNFGIRVIGEDLRMAGFVGLFNDPARVGLARSNMISGTSSENCGSANWPFQLVRQTSGTVGYVEHFPSPGALSCIPAGSFSTSSPALVVRRASGVEASAADLTSNNLFIQSSQAGAIIFMGKDYTSQVKGADRHQQVCRFYSSGTAGSDCKNPVASALCKGPTTGVNAGTGSAFLCDAPIFQYFAHVYYVRPCSRPAGTTCAATDDGGQPIPTLVRRQLANTDPATFIETPIAEGVERMALSFGIDSDEDGIPDAYTSCPLSSSDPTKCDASKLPAGYIVTPDDLGTAVTVRISLLMRTSKQESNYDDSSVTYTLADGTSFNCGTSSSVPCKYRRYVMSDTVQLKNYVFRR